MRTATTDYRDAPLCLRAEKAISSAVTHEISLEHIDGPTPFRHGYIMEYKCLKTGKYFLVRVWADESAPIVYINS